MPKFPSRLRAAKVSRRGTTKIASKTSAKTTTQSKRNSRKNTEERTNPIIPCPDRRPVTNQRASENGNNST